MHGLIKIRSSECVIKGKVGLRRREWTFVYHLELGHRRNSNRSKRKSRVANGARPFPRRFLVIERNLFEFEREGRRHLCIRNEIRSLIMKSFFELLN